MNVKGERKTASLFFKMNHIFGKILSDKLKKVEIR